jgi:hypothetical protein
VAEADRLQIETAAAGEESSTGPRALATGPGSSSLNADTLLLRRTPAAEAARQVVSEHFRKPAAAGQADDDEAGDHNALKRQRTQPGFVATNEDYIRGLREANAAKESAAATVLDKKDLEYERVLRVLTDWAALKSKYSFLGQTTTPTMDQLDPLTKAELGLAIEGTCGKKPAQGNKPEWKAVLVGHTAEQCQLERPAEPVGYRERAARRAAAAAAIAAATLAAPAVA